MTVSPEPSTHRSSLAVLALISGGLILILLAIVAGLFGWFKARANVPLPNWAENVLVAIATAAALKLGDAIAALVALASGRQLETVTNQLAASAPAKPLALPSPERLPDPPVEGQALDQQAAGARQATEAAAETAEDLEARAASERHAEA